MGRYDDGRTISNAKRLRVKHDFDDPRHIYIECDCGAKRYIREAPITECSTCGAHYSFYVKQDAPPIGEE